MILGYRMPILIDRRQALLDALALIEPIRDRPRDHDDHLDVFENPAHVEKGKKYQVSSLK
jgi:hypothetical protein